MKRASVLISLALVASACGSEAQVTEPLRGFDGEVLTDVSDNWTEPVEQAPLTEGPRVDEPVAVAEPVRAQTNREPIQLEPATAENLLRYLTYSVPEGWSVGPTELTYESTGWHITIAEESGDGRVFITLGDPPSNDISNLDSVAPWQTVDEVRAFVDAWESALSEPEEVTVADSSGWSYKSHAFFSDLDGIKYQLVFDDNPTAPVRLLITGDPSDNDALETVNQIIDSIERVN